MKHSFSIPYPPTVNHMYGQRGKSKYIKPEGLKFIADVAAAVAPIITAPGFAPLTGGIVVSVDVYHPDFLRRDITNLSKALDDALSKSGLIEDDEFIDHYTIRRAGFVNSGGCEIVIEQVRNTSMRKQAMEARDELKRQSKPKASRVARGARAGSSGAATGN